MSNYKKPMMKKGMAYKKSLAYKESSKQEKTNLMDENPVADREKDTMAMKKGPMYKTDARVARDYAANAVFDQKHGYKSEAKFEKKKLMHIVNKIAGRNSR